jgi:hypothetical protein
MTATPTLRLVGGRRSRSRAAKPTPAPTDAPVALREIELLNSVPCHEVRSGDVIVMDPKDTYPWVAAYLCRRLNAAEMAEILASTPTKLHTVTRGGTP